MHAIYKYTAIYTGERERHTSDDVRQTHSGYMKEGRQIVPHSNTTVLYHNFAIVQAPQYRCAINRIG